MSAAGDTYFTERLEEEVLKPNNAIKFERGRREQFIVT